METLDCRETEEGISFSVIVQPRSSRCQLMGVQDGSLKVKLTSPPVDGAANKQCVEFLSTLLQVNASAVRITRGEEGRRKQIEVRGLKRGDLMKLLGDPKR